MKIFYYLLWNVIYLYFFTAATLPAKTAHQRLASEKPHSAYLDYRWRLYQHRLQTDPHARLVGERLFAECLPSFAIADPIRHMAKPLVASLISPTAELVDDGEANTARMDMAVSPVTGNLLIVWQDERNSFDAPDIYGQLFDDGFNRIGENFIIAKEHAGIAQLGPAVAALPDGGFVVVWEDYRSGKPAIYLRYLGSSGSLGAEEIAVSEEGSLFPDVACDSSATVTVVWLSFSSDLYAIRGNRLAPGQSPTFPSLFIDDDLDGRVKGAPVVATTVNRSTIVVWEDQRSGDSEIWAQKFNGDGVRQGPNLRINDQGTATIQWHPAISASSFGFAIVWEDLSDSRGAIMLQRFDPNMQGQEANLRIDTADTVIKSLPDLMMRDDGAVYLVWKEAFQLESKMVLTKLSPDNQIEIPIVFSGTEAKYQPKVQVYDAHINLGWMETAEDFFIHVYARQLATSVIPVELTSFTASVHGTSVTLRWCTASESSNLGFEIERRQNDEAFRKIGFREGKGTQQMETWYSFDDPDLPPGFYSYRLKQIDQNGDFVLSSPIAVTIALPSSLQLAQNYPNPFNAETIITFTIGEQGRVLLQLFDTLGRKVRTLMDDDLPPGVYRYQLQAADLPAGVYIYRLERNRKAVVGKLVIVR